MKQSDHAASARSARAARAAATVTKIDQLLREGLHPEQLQVHDDSAKHVGHPGAGGRGHYRVQIVSMRFAGLTSVQRHRLVNQILAPLWETDLHAVSITAQTSDELIK